MADKKKKPIEMDMRTTIQGYAGLSDEERGQVDKYIADAVAHRDGKGKKGTNGDKKADTNGDKKAKEPAR